MRISDWSSDVCSSDLQRVVRHGLRAQRGVLAGRGAGGRPLRRLAGRGLFRRVDVQPGDRRQQGDRKSVVEGKSVSVRVDLGGRRIIKKKKKACNNIDE